MAIKGIPPLRKTAMVAGAAGFLGSHLTDRLLSLGYSVLGVDNLVTGSMRTIAHLTGNSYFKFIEADILLNLDLAADIIFNLACPASPLHYQSDPVRTMKTSFIGTLNLLELARRNGATMVQASTSEVYGDPLQHPQQESYWGNVNPVGARSCYDEGKRAAETLCFDFHRCYGTDTRIARIFNTYGPRMQVQDGRVVSNFIVQALKGEALTVYGDGTQTRSFCYVNDLIDGLVALATSEIRAPTPVNIGNPNEITLLELADMIKALIGINCDMVYLPLPQDDPRQRRPDISLAAEILGWRSRTQLRDGLKLTVDYFRQVI